MKIRVAVVTILMTIGLAGLGAAPAHAATPHCTEGLWGYTPGFGHYFVPAYGGAYNCLLSQGDHTWGVVALQNSLKRCYGQDIAVDGIFGSRTRSALLNAQRWERDVFGENIAVDGIYGPQTNRAMLWPFYRAPGDLAGPHTCYDPA